MAVEANMYDNVLKVLKQIQKAPDDINSDEGLAEHLKALTKELYDHVKNNEPATCQSNSLPELIVHEFNNEQIWQQLKLQNNSCQEQISCDIARFRKTFENKNVSLVCSKVTTDDEEIEEISDEEDVEYEDDDMDDDEEDDNDDALNSKFLDDENDDAMSDISIELEKALDERIARDAEIEMDDETVEDEDDDEFEEDKLEKANSAQRTFRTSVVDDRFFKLDQLTEFLNAEDAKEMVKHRREGNNINRDDDEDDDMLGMFQDIPDDKSLGKSNGNQLKYEDFFDPPEETNTNRSKKVAFNLPGGTESEDDFNDEEADDGNVKKSSKKNEVKSTFEIRQEKTKSRIKELEEGSLADKPWQLLGEAAAHIRPRNSLMNENLQFDHMTRPAPIITLESTQSLENLIKQRIKDQTFDDVERKLKPKENPYDYRKDIVLDHEKSKIGLAEVYEKEYEKQQTGGQQQNDEQEPKEHQDIRKEMKLLFDRLNILVEYRDMPKEPIPDIKIVHNLPAIVMEDITPVAVTDATLLAPEEIMSKSKEEVKGLTERSHTDKLRARRKKKLRIKHKLKATGQKLKPLKQSKNLIDKSGVETKAASKLTSSKEFFARLQGEVQKSKFSKVTKDKSKNKTAQISATKLKL